MLVLLASKVIGFRSVNSNNLHRGVGGATYTAPRLHGVTPQTHAGTPAASALTATATERFELSWSARGITGADKIKHSVFPTICNDQLKGLESLQTFEGEALEVIKLPRGQVLAVAAGDPSPFPAISEPAWQGLKLTTRMSLVLLAEYKKGDKSPFYEYIAQLPEPAGFQTPFHWSPAVLSRLQSAYPPLASSVAKQRRDYEALFASLAGFLSAQGVSYERFVWGMEAVRSRAFQGLGGMDGAGSTRDFLPRGLFAAALMVAAVVIANTNGGGEVVPAVMATAATASLVPLAFKAQKTSCVLLPAIDSSNHHSSKFNCKIEFEPAADAFLLRNTKRIAPGEEVLINYGNRDNDYLCQYFGFVEEDNANDRFVVETERAGAVAPIVVTRRESATWSLPDDLKKQGLRPILAKELDSIDRYLGQPEPQSGDDERLLTVFLQAKRDTLAAALKKL